MPGLSPAYPKLLGCLAVFHAAAACSDSPRKASAEAPSRYLYVWAGTGNDTVPGTNMLTVLDVDPTSSQYGKVLSALTVDTAGRMPHHTEFSLPENAPLFVNDFSGDKSFMIDFKDAANPRLAGRVAPVPQTRRVHSFARLANGHVIATIQYGDGKSEGDPGGLAEFDGEGKLIRQSSSRDAAFPGAKIRTYGITILPKLDRVVTSSSPMAIEPSAHVIQVWRLSDLSLLKTLSVPQVAGDSSHMYPFELRTLADGKTVMMNTYFCGFYRITDTDNDPKIERVMALKLPENIGCSVPLIKGKFMIMPIAYAHRFVTIDISDPVRPKEVASFATDTTFFPHWIAADPRSDRVVFTDQGDGRPLVLMAHFDSATGRLRWDDRFRDPGTTVRGVSYHRANWPNGVKGMAMPHGALFVP